MFCLNHSFIFIFLSFRITYIIRCILSPYPCYVDYYGENAKESICYKVMN